MEETERVKEAFTEQALSYTKTMDKELSQFWGISYPQFVDRLVRKAGVMPDETVLDIATGTAVIPATLIAEHPYREHVVGLDITPAMLCQGRESLAENQSAKKVDLVCASAVEMPFANGIFDVIICGLGTHHMNVPRMLEEAKRLLAKDGRLIISDLGATPFWRRTTGKVLLKLLMLEYGFVNRRSRSRAEIEAFKNVRTAQEWLEMLKDFGFIKIRIEDIRPRLPWFPSGLTLQAVIAK
ncbi:MAG: class I SAM-dependent methyltransferase [Acidobacteriaceae bacterium]